MSDRERAPPWRGDWAAGRLGTGPPRAAPDGERADPTRSCCFWSSAVSTGALTVLGSDPCASRKRSRNAAYHLTYRYGTLTSSAAAAVQHNAHNLRTLRAAAAAVQHNAHGGRKRKAKAKRRPARTHLARREGARTGLDPADTIRLTIDHNATPVHVPLKPQRDTDGITHRKAKRRACRSPGHIHVPSCNPPPQQTHAACERGRA